jgi:peptide/nickel transport system substrate-binding protein
MTRLVAALVVLVTLLGPMPDTGAQTRPEGEMRWAVYVTLSPQWFDPAEVIGVLTPFWVMYALHDALVKPMPGTLLSPSLAESWTVSADQRVYEFKLREGLKFHNGDPFTAEDVKFSFLRAKGARQLQDKVREVTVVDRHRVRFQLAEPWPDFMTYYGTLATSAAWIAPKKYMEQVGVEGFKKHPIGLGPYKFVSHTPGVELVMEAFEGYWRKTPSVKRLVYKSVPEATTRLAMLKRGEVDIAYLLDAPMADEIKRDPSLKVAFSGAIGTFYLDFLEQFDPKSPWADRRVRQAASLAVDRKGLNEAENLGASRLNGNIVPRTFEFAIPIEPDPYDPARARQLLAEAGIRTRVRAMERAAFYAALSSKKLKGVCVCINAVYGNAASRMAQTVPPDGAFAYGSYPDIEALYRQQAGELDRRKRAELLRRLQLALHERVRFAPIYDYIWPSGIGPRVEEPALMLIDPYPWSAPLEDVRLKKR